MKKIAQNPSQYRQEFSAFISEHFSEVLAVEEQSLLSRSGGWRTLLESVRS
ncbi:MAG: hypothetical protein AB7F75_11570 [Planctomycetota bacterium]